MTIARIYHPKVMETGDRCDLTGGDRQYVLSILRMKKGEGLLLFDGKGCEYETVILGHDPERVSLEIIGKEVKHREPIAITLAQSLPKVRKIDLIIENASSLGVNIMIPFVSERSVPQLSPDKIKLKQTRWQKIALEAARKSHSPGIPEVQAVLPFEKMLHRAEGADVKIVFWEEETRMDLKQVLQEEGNASARNFFLVVGPEGGFSRREIELAQGLGFISVSLGRQILKVETAALAILSIIQYEKGNFSPTVKGGSL